MIVKNEEKTLPRLIRSLKPHIHAAVIHDTGSTDNTINVLREELQGVETTIKEVEWKSFGENRTNAIKDAGDEGYLILADADFEYVVQDGVLDSLTLDGYYVPISEDNMIYSLITLVKAGLSWNYVGRTHEYIDHTNYSCGYLSQNNLYIKHHHDGGARGDKFIRDLKLLEEDYQEDPANFRTVFYLAQTHECLGNIDEAVNWYFKRSSMGGWAEENYVAQLRAGRLSNDLQTLLEAHSYRPQRLEALYEASIILRSAPNVVIDLLKDKVHNPLPSDVLFVERYIWDFALKFELGQAYYAVGESEKGNSIFKDILYRGLPDAYRDYILGNNLVTI